MSITGNKRVIEIQVVKNRNGEIGMCKVKFNPTVGIFFSLNNSKK